MPRIESEPAGDLAAELHSESRRGNRRRRHTGGQFFDRIIADHCRINIVDLANRELKVLGSECTERDSIDQHGIPDPSKMPAKTN